MSTTGDALARMLRRSASDPQGGYRDPALSLDDPPRLLLHRAAAEQLSASDLRCVIRLRTCCLLLAMPIRSPHTRAVGLPNLHS